MELCEKIKKLRIQNNYKQEELAELCNVTRSAVSNWETGRRIPDWDNIVIIARLFNVTVEDLANDKAITKKPPNSFFSAISEAKIKSIELPLFFSGLLFLIICLLISSLMQKVNGLYYNSKHKNIGFCENVLSYELISPIDSQDAVVRLEEIPNKKNLSSDVSKHVHHYSCITKVYYQELITIKCKLKDGNYMMLLDNEYMSIHSNSNNSNSIIKYDAFSKKYYLSTKIKKSLKVKIDLQIEESCIYISAFLV